MDTEDQVVYIKGHYIINRDNEDYSEYDTDEKSIAIRKQEKVRALSDQYKINERKLDQKVVLCVVLPFCLVSFIHYMTRFLIAVAAESGLKEDLNLLDFQYNVATAVFFIPYVIFELVSNLILKYVRPHYFMSFYVLMLGITIIANGFVTNFAGLVVCRMFTGLFQLNSLALYYVLANYFANHNSQRMFTAYYSFGLIGGLLSFLLTNVGSHIPVLKLWSWIYIIEGIIAVFLAFVLFFIIPDFPEGARFLSDDETLFLVKKLEVYNGKSGYQLHISFRDILKVLRDPLLWWGTLTYFGLLGCSYGYAYFEPAIVKSILKGMSQNEELLLEAFPFLMAFFLANLMAILLDYFQKRAPFAITSMSMVLIGLVLVQQNPTNGPRRYCGCALSIIGLSCAIPIVVCWVVMNFGGHLRKNVSTAWLVSFASISGIASTFTFDTNDAPVYTIGIWTDIAFICFLFLFMVIYLLSLYQGSKRKTYKLYRQEFDALGSREKTFLGDKNPLFKYIL